MFRIPLPHIEAVVFPPFVRRSGIGLPKSKKEGVFMSKFNAKRICYIALLAAMYYVLNLLEIRTPGNLHVTLDALPLMVSALLLGPVDAGLVAFFGELLNQVVGPYGITATTLLWVLPPVIYGLIIGVVAKRQSGKPMETRVVFCYVVCILAAVVRSAGNTLVIWADSVIYGYYSFAIVFGAAAIRFVAGIVAAVLVATVAMPLVRILRKQRIRRG